MGTLVELKSLPIFFPVLAAPKPSKMRSTPKYSCAVGFNQGDQVHMAELQKLQAVIQQVAAENKSNSLPKIVASTNNPQFMFANATSTSDQPPVIRDIANQEIPRMMAGQEFYSGAICNFVYDVYFTPTHGRVCLSVVGVQKIADGPRFDGAPNPDSLFQAGTPQPQQQQYAPPPPNTVYQPPAQPQQGVAPPFPGVTTPGGNTDPLS